MCVEREAASAAGSGLRRRLFFASAGPADATSTASTTSAAVRIAWAVSRAHTVPMITVHGSNENKLGFRCDDLNLNTVMPKEAFIVRVARTAAGKRAGALSHYHPAVLGGTDRRPIHPKFILPFCSPAPDPLLDQPKVWTPLLSAPTSTPR